MATPPPPADDGGATAGDTVPPLEDASGHQVVSPMPSPISATSNTAATAGGHATPGLRAAHKEAVLTPEQAALENKRLQKGYAYVPATVPAATDPVVLSGKRTRKPVNRDTFLDNISQPSRRRMKHSENGAADDMSVTSSNTGRSATGGFHATNGKTPGKLMTKTPGRGRGMGRSPGTPVTPTAAPGVVPDPDRQLLLQTKLALLQSRLEAVKSGHVVAAPALAPTTPAPGKPGKGGRRSTPAPVHTPHTPIDVDAPMTPAGGIDPASLQRTTSRSNRAIKPPKVLTSEALAAQQVKLGEPLRRCRDLLTKLFRDKWAWPFVDPVDWNAMKLSDYPVIIRWPMDLGTVRDKLSNGEYENVEQFEEDVEQVWANAMTYNLPGSDAYAMALHLKKIFMEGMEKIPLVELPKPKKATPKTRTPGVLGGGGGVGGSNQLEAQVASLTQKLAEVENQLYESKTPVRRPLEETPLNFKEKQALRADIFKLPGDRLGKVVEIIAENMPAGQQPDDGEIEIDIDQLNIITLRKLQRYVKTTLMSLRRQQTTTIKRKAPSGGGSVAKRPRSEEATPVNYGYMDTEETGQMQQAQAEDEESSASDSGSDSDESDDEMAGLQYVPPSSSYNTGYNEPATTVFDVPSDGGAGTGAEAVAMEDEAMLAANIPSPEPLLEPEDGSAQDARLAYVTVDSNAWSGLQSSAAPVPAAAVSSPEATSQDKLWADFKSKTEEMKLKEQQQRAEEERLLRERERQAEELRRRAEQHAAEEAAERERLRKEEEAAEAARRAQIEAEREAARKARESASVTSVNLDQQALDMDEFGKYGSSASLFRQQGSS